MKTITLLLISMFIFSGCDLKMGALFDRKIDYGPTWASSLTLLVSWETSIYEGCVQ